MAREPCKEGLKTAGFGEARNWWNETQPQDELTLGGGAESWTFRQIVEDTDPFMHARIQCEKGCHMSCMIMETFLSVFR